ncbi:ribonuclease P protein subunit p25-like [Corythoichthys intestinalis]|uniref:ribonuclease P protein subunit p25-like n=1 Tax=Corythoichthys intestinalis TaxID=161448 RepID=UPI0025A5CBDE|nr:ribonuclease P protein subunit p25-like [Corythoichthys intestinalis]XP_061812915.1 ribonuclease P protein subunit p25-like [Nerophis lumbriciformis]
MTEPTSQRMCPSTSLNSAIQSFSPMPYQNNLRKVKQTEDSCPFPIPGLAADFFHMRVKEGSKIRNLLRFATARMQGEGNEIHGRPQRQVVFTGSDRGVTKTITCVEILKRKVEGLHQVSKLYYKTVNEVWKGSLHSAPGITIQRTVPVICILLSKDPLNPQEPGYQPPRSTSAPTDSTWICKTSLRPPQCPTLAKRLYLEK